MADLTNFEKRRLERILQMGGGYVLGFSNRTLSDFVLGSINRDIYGTPYGSQSKASQLRGFWDNEPNTLVGKLLGDLLDYGVETKVIKTDDDHLVECRKIVERLKQGSDITDAGALVASTDERDFEAVARAVRTAIDSNDLESGLDRLHTFVTKFLRTLCTQHGIVVARDKPLHSLMGEYIKQVRDEGHIESEMTVRILKSSISTLEAFNSVRNNQSLAHDNPILNFEEALLIFNHVASSIRFVKAIEERIPRQPPQPAFDNDIPF